MKRNKSLLFVLVLASISFSSCSGPKTPCTVNCGGGGNATVSLTLVADTPPANPSILSFKVSVLGITFTPTTGTAQNFQPSSPIVVDLMRLQSDTAFLGTLTNVPSGTYTLQVSVSSPEITFFNDTASTITVGSTTCPTGSVCSATLATAGTPAVSSFTFSATGAGKQGVEIDFNLANAISLSGGTLSVNFTPSAPNPGVFTAFTLPRTNANLGTSQLELIEDFTGVVSITGSTVTITSPTRGALATTVTSSSFFDQSPAPTNLCPSAPNNCAAAGQIASVDAFLNADGTLSLKEFEPLVATQKDFVEGIVSAVNTQTQFAMVVADKVQAATNSLIAGLNVGDRLTVNIPSATIHPFLVDTKGLIVPPGAVGNFRGQTDTTAIHLGQTIAVNVTNFTAASGSAIAAVTSDTVTLRWSRFTALPTGASSSTLVSVNNLPSYFNFTPAFISSMQIFSGTLGTGGATNLEGFPSDTSNLTAGKPVEFRALFLENTQLTANPAFSAAKVRQR